MSISKETIGKRIKAFRKGRGLTQAQLARDLGYSHKSVITHIEKGESEMSYEKMLLLLRTYAVDANELFDVQHIDNLLEEHKRFKKAKEKKNAWMKDILFDIDGELFSYRVGGVLIKNNQVLLTKGGDDYSLPGGHAQIGETSCETIIREFKEETGFDVEPINVISTFENYWNWDNKRCHQLCIFYRLKIKGENQELIPNPDDKRIKFVWISLNDLANVKLYPLGIAKLITDQIVDNTHFVFKE